MAIDRWWRRTSKVAPPRPAPVWPEITPTALTLNYRLSNELKELELEEQNIILQRKIDEARERKRKRETE